MCVHLTVKSVHFTVQLNLSNPSLCKSTTLPELAILFGPKSHPCIGVNLSIPATSLIWTNFLVPRWRIREVLRYIQSRHMLRASLLTLATSALSPVFRKPMFGSSVTTSLLSDLQGRGGTKKFTSIQQPPEWFTCCGTDHWTVPKGRLPVYRDHPT